MSRNTADQLVTLAYTPRKSFAEELPVELISSIASFLVGSELDESPPFNLRNLVAATHVCHRWREAILNDPRLWTDIEMSLTPHASDILAKVFALSGSLALRISADFLDSDPALTQIYNVSTRCDSLTLILPYEPCSELILQARSFPQLRCLSLTPIPGMGDEFEISSVTRAHAHKFWESFPALRELTLQGSQAEWMRPLPSGRCLETVVIKIAGDAGDLFFDFIDMLDSSETITSVTFHAKSCDVDVENLALNNELEVVINEKIETLCLKDYGVRLLRYVSCPALRTFSVDTLWWDSDDVPEEVSENVMQSLMDFLVLAKPPLENITLGADEFPLFALPLVLGAVPRLKAFSLRVYLFSDLSFLTEFFDELSKKCRGVFEVVPVLEKLSIALPVYPSSQKEDKFVDGVDGKHFVNMILERTDESCMRSVSVKVGRGGRCDLTEADIFALQECKRRVDGLEIDIHDARGAAV